MITRVRKYIRDNRMLKAEDMVVAGVSGGADSIAMLHILKSLQKEIGFSMEVVHVHHGIRGQEADRAKQFVEKICSGLRWHIIATIWQRLCCIIWQGEPVSGDFPGYRR